MLQARAKQVSAKSDEAGNPKELHAKRERAILEVDDDNAYDEAERVMHRKKAAKLAKYSAPALQPPLEDEQINGARKVTKAVEKNRGLTPHRRKDTKNPRVKVGLLDRRPSLCPCSSMATQLQLQLQCEGQLCVNLLIVQRRAARSSRRPQFAAKDRWLR